MSLPSGFIELEYIQSSGTQYVDTGIRVNATDTMRCDIVQTITPPSSGTLEGADCYMQIGLTPNGYGGVYRETALAPYGNKDAISVIFLNKVETVYINGTAIDSWDWNGTTISNVTLGLLKLGAANGSWYTSPAVAAKTYSCQIYDNGLLMRDYVPAKTIEGEIGLYDRVFHEFYRNAGTGAFIAGPEMEHEGYTELEWIESSGTQYVDTEWTANQNTSATIKFSTKQQSGGGILAAMQGWRNRGFGIFVNAIIFGSSATDRDGMFGDGNIHEVKLASAQCYDNGSLIWSGSVSTFTTPVTLTICKSNVVSEAHEYSSAKIYSCQIYDNGVIVRIYIPMLHPSGVPGLWDEVNQRFYASASGTDLLAGPVVVKVPEAPANFRRVSSTGTTVTLAWDAAETATGYRLYRDGVLVADLAGTQFTDAIETNVTYSYTLTAYNENGESEAAELSVFVEPPPEPPENFRQTGQTMTTISLAWDAVSGADSYYLFRGGMLVEIVTSTTYTDRDLKRGAYYTYEISSAKNGAIGEAVSLVARTQYELNLITDRTQTDVDERNEKGVYGAADLNRVGDAMSYVAGVFNEQGFSVSIQPKIDWTENDWPTTASMKHYLDCLAKLRGVMAIYSTTPQVPESMEKLRYPTANEIEMILVDIDWLLNHIYAAYRHCGAINCGQGGLFL